MRLKVGQYRQAIKLKIPPLYPEHGIVIEFLGSNFPADMQYMFRCQGTCHVHRTVMYCNVI